MNKEELNEFIKTNRENYSIQLKRHHLSLYDEIDNLYNFKTFGQKLYHFIYGENSGKCEVCGKICMFDSFYKGYRKKCSYTCAGSSRHTKSREVRKCVICSSEFEIYKNREKTTCSNICLLKLNASPEVVTKRMVSLKKTMIEKYGVDHSSKLPDSVKKSKKTKLERYGDENYINVEKGRRTKLKKYGRENYVNTEKSKLTKLERYGDGNYNNREKFRSTNLHLYGVEYPIQSDHFKTKQKITFTEKFGGIGLKSDELRKKIELTNLMKYGFKVASQNQTVINNSKRTWYDKTYEMLLNTDRLENKVKPLFSKEEYEGSKKKYKFLCLKCNVEFVGSIEDGKIPRCLSCYPFTTNHSKPELEILEFLKSLGILDSDIINHDRKILKGLELDFYLPKFNLAIEFNGIIWHSECMGNKDKRYHLNKTEECAKSNIHLVHIFEPEWELKKDIIKSKLKHILKLNTIDKVYARKCELKEISSFIKNSFLNTHHLQGSDKSTISIGAFYNDELVSVMTFGKPRIALGSKNSVSDEYELYRFCVSKSVIGIASKMLNYFIKKYSPTKIITYADRRFSNNSSFYNKLGFVFEKNTTPNYWYFSLKLPYEVYHRYSFRKSELHKKLQNFNADLSEWENMKLNGYDRIWDCGNLKYIWTKQ